MIPSFDIFQTETDGSVRWIGTAHTMADAKMRVRQHLATAPGEYLLVNQRTGTKLVISADEADTTGSC